MPYSAALDKTPGAKKGREELYYVYCSIPKSFNSVRYLSVVGNIFIKAPALRPGYEFIAPSLL